MANRSRNTDPGPADVPLDFTIPEYRDNATQGDAGRAVRPYAYGKCPMCSGGGKQVALILSSSHIVWNQHFIFVGLKAPWTILPCRASGVPLCVSGAMPVGGQFTVVQFRKQALNDPLRGVRKAKCLHRQDAASHVSPA